MFESNFVFSALSSKQVRELGLVCKLLDRKQEREVLGALMDAFGSVGEDWRERFETLKILFGADGVATLCNCLAAGISGLDKAYSLQVDKDLPGAIGVIEKFFGNNGDGNGVEKALRLLAEFLVVHEKELRELQRHHGQALEAVLGICLTAGIKVGMNGIEINQWVEEEEKPKGGARTKRTIAQC